MPDEDVSAQEEIAEIRQRIDAIDANLCACQRARSVLARHTSSQATRTGDSTTPSAKEIFANVASAMKGPLWR
jgi:hypothetical protein